MADYLLTPNMGLTEPIVGVTTGTNYATYINNSLTLLDQHDHSAGKGVQITPAGLNIDEALTFQGNSATNVSQINFTLSSISPVTAQTLYVKNGSETVPLPDLWYYDGNTQIQITSNGQTATTLANLPGESYAGGTFTWRQGTGSTVPANFDIGSIIIRPNIAATADGVELSSPATAAYTLTFPNTLPASGTAFLTVDSTGAIGDSIGTIDSIPADAIVNNSITDAQIQPQGISAASILNNTITGNQITSNVNLPGNAATVNNAGIITSQTTVSGHPLQIIRGTTAPGGGATIASGEGFSISGTGGGLYTITFAAAFNSAPSVVAAINYINGGSGPGAIVGIISIFNISTTGFQYWTLAGNGAGETNFGISFIAIGPR